MNQMSHGRLPETETVSQKHASENVVRYFNVTKDEKTFVIIIVYTRFSEVGTGGVLQKRCS